MERVIELLKERGFVDTLQRCVNATNKLVEGGVNEESMLAAGKDTLFKYINKHDENDELFDAFLDFATDMALEAIIKKLDLKPDENYEPDNIEKLITLLAKLTK